MFFFLKYYKQKKKIIGMLIKFIYRYLQVYIKL